MHRYCVASTGHTWGNRLNFNPAIADEKLPNLRQVPHARPERRGRTLTHGPVRMEPVTTEKEKFMTTMQAPVDNGVNVEALLGVRDALAETPEIAQFQWRATVSWVGGTHSRSTVDTFYGFGEQQHHKTTFTYDIDHPLAFAAQDNGISPVEYVLVALGGCLTAGIASIAQHRKIQLRSVQATVEADEDLHGILGADPEIRNGFTGVRVSYQIDADATPEQIKALVAQSQKRSAVYDILTNPTPVTVTVDVP